MSPFERAWKWRVQAGFLESHLLPDRSLDRRDAVRVFHGPGEGNGASSSLAIDRFGDHYWVTDWTSKGTAFRSGVREELLSFLKQKGAFSVVGCIRSDTEAGDPTLETWWGTPPAGRLQVQEGESRFWVQFRDVRHPGLFLDQQPLRAWLRRSMAGSRVCNAFAYTGSLSVAAAQAGAQHVTTLDLSGASLQWARANLELNQVPSEKLQFIAGDVFEWFPQLKKSGKNFDCMILDPPSFSRGKNGFFSTQKDLKKLHSLAFDLLDHDGILVTSLNSANLSWQKYQTEVQQAADAVGVRLQVLKTIGLPETFPTRLDAPLSRYLKGWVFRVERLGSQSRSQGSGSSKKRTSLDIGWSKRSR